MSLILLITTSTLLAAPNQNGPDADQFDRIIKEVHSKIRDITFIYEGTSDFVGPAEILHSGHRPFHEAFQGTYSHRSDGATWLDVYRYYEDAATAYHHDTRISFKGTESSLSRSPDSGKSPLKPKTSFGYPGCLNDEDSPEGMLYYWLFQDTKNYAKFEYENLGWETVDSHKCLKIKLNILPQPRRGPEPYHVYWIDLSRGGHPIQIERFENNTFMYRTKVELVEILVPNAGTVWLPRRAELLGFFWEGQLYKNPVIKSSYTIVNGSVLINQGLEDSYFSVDHTASNFPGGYNSPTRDGFEAARKSPLLRVDPVGVKDRLDKALIVADKQANELTATNSSSIRFDITIIVQGIFLALGAAILALAIIVKKRK